MTCKDCIHYEACHDMYYEEHATRHFDPEKHNAEKECGYFKDRSRFVELPCKIGDVVYRICPINDGDDCRRCPYVCVDCYDIGFVNDNANPIRSGKVNSLDWVIKHLHYFGKLYFTTKEEAEQALNKTGDKNA